MDAFEKAKKRQSLEKKRMKQELLSYMNQVHQGGSAPTNEVMKGERESSHREGEREDVVGMRWCVMYVACVVKDIGSKLKAKVMKNLMVINGDRS